MSEFQRRNGKRGCCPACRRDADLLRRNPVRISEFIDEIAECLHGYHVRAQRVHEHRPHGQRHMATEMNYIATWGGPR